MIKMMHLVFLALILLLSLGTLIPGVERQGEGKVVFEEIGHFNDGGRPNGLHVIGDLAYMADGADGLEIIRFRKK